MNKTIRFLLILALLVGVVVVAGSKAVWASPASPSPAEKANPAPAAAGLNVGTVIVPAPEEPKGPGDAGTSLKGFGDGPVSIWGAATLQGLGSNADVLASLDPKPDGYLSKIVVLQFSSGEARLCFAAVNGDETINFNVDGVWTPLFTFYVDGQACVDVSTSGEYVLGH